MDSPLAVYPQRVCWAVDAFEDPAILERQAAEVSFGFISRIPGVTIQPIYTLSPSQNHFEVLLASGRLEVYRSEIENNLTEILNPLHLPFLNQPEVILEPHGAYSQIADALLRKAAENESDLIVAYRHDRRGFSRLFTSSFTAPLLDRSAIPVFVASKKHPLPGQLESILFVTDFSFGFEMALSKVGALARAFQAKILMLSHISQPDRGITDFEIGNRMHEWQGRLVPWPEYLRHRVRQEQTQAKKWLSHAPNMDAEVMVDSESERIDDAVLSAVQRRPVQLVVLAHSEGAVLAKRMLKRLPCPLLEFPSLLKHKSHKEAA